jgi:hypothetical protein
MKTPAAPALLVLAALLVSPVRAGGMLDGRLVVPCAPGTARLNGAMTTQDNHGQLVPVCASINAVFTRRDVQRVFADGRNVAVYLDARGAARLAQAAAGYPHRIVLVYRGDVIADEPAPAVDGPILYVALRKSDRDALLADFNTRAVP